MGTKDFDVSPCTQEIVDIGHCRHPKTRRVHSEAQHTSCPCTHAFAPDQGLLGIAPHSTPLLIFSLLRGAETFCCRCRSNLCSFLSCSMPPGGWTVPWPLSSNWIRPVGSQAGKWGAGGQRHVSFCSPAPSLCLARTEGDNSAVATPHSEPVLGLTREHSRMLSFSLDFSTHTFPLFLQAQFQPQTLHFTLVSLPPVHTFVNHLFIKFSSNDPI